MKIKSLILIATSLIIAGTLCIDYTKSIYLFLGLILFYILKKLSDNSPKIKSLLSLLFSSLLLVLLLTISIIITNPDSEQAPQTPQPSIRIRSYKVILKPKTKKMEEFLATITLQIDKEHTISIKETIREEKQGLLIKKLKLPLYFINNRKKIKGKLPNHPNHIYCYNQNKCKGKIIKLEEFPINSFISTKDPEAIPKSIKHLQKEYITWSINNLNEDIEIAYIPPPFNNFKNTIKLFMWFDTIEKYLMIPFGLTIGLINSKIQILSNKNKNTKVKIILILASNPKNTSRLRLDQETREIESELRKAKKQNIFVLKQKWAVRIHDIQQSLLDFKPQIIHFSGHGYGDNGLVLEDDSGLNKIVETEPLAQLFKLFANDIQCVILNACYSKVQAKAIAKHIPYTIGMSQEIGDEAAINFAIGFYKALAAGESIEFAYNLGCNSIQLDGIPEHLTPVLIKKNKNPTHGGGGFSCDRTNVL